MNRRRFALLAISIAALGCSAGPGNGQFQTSIAAGLTPRLAAADAVAISRAYLDRQTPELAVPQMHREPQISAVWALAARDAAAIDGCIPKRTSDQVVWVTKGVGDYLNLRDLPWSHATAQAEADTALAMACGGPGPAGTIVIDDATGAILGVYPAIPSDPHPTAAPSG
jgi:hypothetical protein